MKIKKVKTKVGKARSLRATVQYLLSLENLEHDEDLDEGLDATSELKGPRVIASGSLNAWESDFDSGLSEIKEIDKYYKVLLTALMEPAMCTPNGATLGGDSGVRTHRKVRCFPPHRQRGF